MAKGATLVGFEEVEVGIFDAAGSKTLETFVWKDEDGGTIKLGISGLEPDEVKMRASNKNVWVSKRGTSDVKTSFETFNPPLEELDKVLGAVADSNGISWVGDDTEAPYVSMICKSSDIFGNPVYLGLVKGKMGLDSIDLNTTEEKAKEPESTKLTGSWISREIEGESRIYGRAVTPEQYTALRNAIFPGLTEPTAL